MARQTRQAAILNIIATQDIETQDELVAELSRQGLDVTQATISRDIKELGLIKTLTAGGKYKYATKQSMDPVLSGKLLSVVREAVLSVAVAENIVVVKTLGESASVVSGAVEQLALREVLGVVGDKSTVLVVCSDSHDASIVRRKLSELL